MDSLNSQQLFKLKKKKKKDAFPTPSTPVVFQQLPNERGVKTRVWVSSREKVEGKVTGGG